MAPRPPRPDPLAAHPNRRHTEATHGPAPAPYDPVQTALDHQAAIPIRVAFLGRTSTVEQQDPTLSIPRQLHSVQRNLPPSATITRRFYDIESGRTDLDERGLSRAHELFEIPVRRDGGIRELLAEATSPARAFDAVACESIDRVARITYFGTKIEYELQRVGVILLAADEPQGGKHSTKTLTRRMKQGVAEWYALELLEASRDGLEAHIRQGWNIGHPPYGYLAERVEHPVPAKRREGKTKARLILDPTRAPVVLEIFTWRIHQHLGYRSIAKRLNQDLDRYPPPNANVPDATLGHWTDSAVADLLANPKYTGYMVWNRRAKGKSTGNRRRPPDQWVWSPQSTHPAIITLEQYTQAAQVAADHEGSRDGTDPNRHPRTTHTYMLRSYLRCAHCGWRLCGRTINHHRVYYRCPAVEADPIGVLRRIPDHPRTLYVREDYLLDGILDFFTQQIFHPDRRQRLTNQLQATTQHTTTDLQRQRRALTRSIQDLTAQQQRLATTLAYEQDEEGKLFAQIREQFYELNGQLEQRPRELTALDERQVNVDALDLLDALPTAAGRLDELPEPILRRLFQAFHLKVEYDRHTNFATIEVTLSGDDLVELQEAATATVHAAPTKAEEGRAAGQGTERSPVPHAPGLPPAATRLMPATTEASRNRAHCGVIVPRRTSSSRRFARTTNFRTLTAQCRRVTSGITTCSREPSASDASTNGLDRSTRRPLARNISSTRSWTCSSLSTVPVRIGRPALATNTLSGWLIQISSISGSSKYPCNGPSPITRSATALAIAAGSTSAGMLAVRVRSA